MRSEEFIDYAAKFDCIGESLMFFSANDDATAGFDFATCMKRPALLLGPTRKFLSITALSPASPPPDFGPGARVPNR